MCPRLISKVVLVVITNKGLKLQGCDVSKNGDAKITPCAGVHTCTVQDVF